MFSGFQIQEGASGEKQDPAAGGSKPKVKVKSIDLPIVANNIRQLDCDVLNDFVEYEASVLLLAFGKAESWSD